MVALSLRAYANGGGTVSVETEKKCKDAGCPRKGGVVYDGGDRLLSLTHWTLVIGFAGESDPTLLLVSQLWNDALVAQQMPNCEYVELPGAYAILSVLADHERRVAAIEEFFASSEPPPDHDVSGTLLS
jgi:hypothetical protein